MIGVAWLTRSSERFFAASAVFIVVNIALTIFIAVGLVAGLFTPETLPEGLLLAMDHTMFIGVMTNALLGLIQGVVDERQVGWLWVNDAVFWSMNIGLVGFSVGLITGLTILQRVFTPIMGIGILLAIFAYAPLLMRRPAAAKGTAA